MLSLTCILLSLKFTNYKFLDGLSPQITNKVFETNDFAHDLRNPRILASKHKSAIKDGIDTTTFKGPQIWQNIYLGIRNSRSYTIFKLNIKEIRAYVAAANFAVHS